MIPKPLSFLWRADLFIPIKSAVFDILPLNFFNCVVKYSFSKFSLASFNGIDKEYLTTQLKKFNGNISKTADFIGMERSALHRKLKILGIKELN